MHTGGTHLQSGSYFSRPPDIQYPHFQKGTWIAKDFDNLDACSTRCNPTTLSALLYPPQFLDPGVVATALKNILATIKTSPEIVAHPQQVSDDLLALISGLEQCSAEDIQVTLVLREGKDCGISGLEMDTLKRQFGGSFF